MLVEVKDAWGHVEIARERYILRYKAIYLSIIGLQSAVLRCISGLEDKKVLQKLGVLIILLQSVGISFVRTMKKKLLERYKNDANNMWYANCE